MSEWNDETRRRLRHLRVEGVAVEEFVAQAWDVATKRALHDTGSRIYGRRQRKRQPGVYLQPMSDFRRKISKSLVKLGRLLRYLAIIAGVGAAGFLAVRFFGFKHVAIAVGISIGVLLLCGLVAVVILLVIDRRKQDKD